MSPLALSCVICLLVLGGVFIGFRRALPENHLSKETQDVARAHVEWGRGVIARQQQCVKELRESGHDTEVEKLLAAEKLLAVFERTQKVFERDLANLGKRAASTS